MNKARIQVYVADEAKRRIELAAFIREIPVTEYCLEAIEQRLAEDDVLDRDEVAVRVGPKAPTTVLVDLAAIRARILTRRGGRPLDESVLDSLREERIDELTRLR